MDEKLTIKSGWDAFVKQSPAINKMSIHSQKGLEAAYYEGALHMVSVLYKTAKTGADPVDVGMAFLAEYESLVKEIGKITTGEKQHGTTN